MGVRLSISHKLMLALLGLTLVVLIATLGLARWSFERGFLDYVNALEQTRLARLSTGVKQRYVENGRQWQGADTQWLNRFINHIPGRHPPPPMGRGKLELRPPSNKSSKKSPSTALLDKQGRLVVGRDLAQFTGESIDVPLIIDGVTIGLLKSQPRRKFDSSIETAFSRQQWITSGVIGIASLLLAALVSWGLVGLLLSPVRRMISSVNQLSKGDYSQQLQESRHDEFGQLMGDINHLTQTLEKNQTARRRWIADISHELRTPLAILTGEIEALKDGIRPFNPAQLHSLDQEVQRLCHLTDDLYELSVSDIGGLRYEFSEMDLVLNVAQSIQSHEMTSQKKGVSLSLEGDESVLISADNKRINQLLSNLINNSLTYTDAPGRTVLSVQRLQGNAILSISDTSPSVEQADCSQLFEPLYRQDASRARRDSGAGLGLAICCNIVAAHRGTIQAEPSTLGGLRIVIELPLSQQETA